MSNRPSVFEYPDFSQDTNNVTITQGYRPPSIVGSSGTFTVPYPGVITESPSLDGAKSAGGTKHDGDKLRMELLPIYSLEEIAKVCTYGAKKYDAWNWKKGISYSRLLGATMRHLLSWARGIDKDPETGLSHLSHAGCNILFLLWMEKYRVDLDDRSKDEVSVSSNNQ